MYRKLFVAVLVLACMPVGAGAKVWSVPSGLAPTIQAAVDSAAASGDLIQIAAGVYHETGIVVDGKNLTIDQAGGQVYLIYPSSGNGTCITFRNATGGFLNSLSFRGFDTAVAIENASPTVEFVTLKACNRGVTLSGAGSPKVWYSLVDSCTTGIEVQGGTATLQNETIVNCATGARFLGGSATLTLSIVYRCLTGTQCSGGSAALGCNDFFINGTDYGGCAAGANDFYTDPKFCFWASSAGPYWLHSTSPCLVTSQNPCGVRIGAFTNPIAGCSGAAVRESSWGAIKAIYR